MADMIGIPPEPKATRRAMLHVWSDPRQVAFRESIREDEDFLKWLDPPEVQEPETRYMKVLTVEVAVRPEDDQEEVADSIARHLKGISREIEVNVTDERYVRVISGKWYRPGDVFDSPLPNENPKLFHHYLNPMTHDECLVPGCGQHATHNVHLLPDYVA